MRDYSHRKGISTKRWVASERQTLEALIRLHPADDAWAIAERYVVIYPHRTKQAVALRYYDVIKEQRRPKATSSELKSLVRGLTEHVAEKMTAAAPAELTYRVVRSFACEEWVDVKAKSETEAMKMAARIRRRHWQQGGAQIANVRVASVDVQPAPLGRRKWPVAR